MAVVTGPGTSEEISRHIANFFQNKTSQVETSDLVIDNQENRYKWESIIYDALELTKEGGVIIFRTSIGDDRAAGNLRNNMARDTFGKRVREGASANKRCLLILAMDKESHRKYLATQYAGQSTPFDSYYLG